MKGPGRLVGVEAHALGEESAKFAHLYPQPLRLVLGLHFWLTVLTRRIRFPTRMHEDWPGHT